MGSAVAASMAAMMVVMSAPAMANDLFNNDNDVLDNDLFDHDLFDRHLFDNDRRDFFDNDRRDLLDKRQSRGGAEGLGSLSPWPFFYVPPEFPRTPYTGSPVSEKGSSRLLGE
jgi:hypothetical protein